jgi:hypothetical protein
MGMDIMEEMAIVKVIMIIMVQNVMMQMMTEPFMFLSLIYTM